MKRYDGVVIVDFPVNSTAAQEVLTLDESGNITTETLRAFPFEEFRGIVGAMPRRVCRMRGGEMTNSVKQG